MVDLPALVIPVKDKVDPVLDPIDKNYVPVSRRDAEIQAMCTCESMMYRTLNQLCILDTPERFENAPLTIQLVGRRYREEEVIGMAGLVVEALELRAVSEEV